MVNKSYNYLDQKNKEFDHDYTTFFVMVQSLKDDLAFTIENNFSSVWETGQGIKFLDKFEKVFHLLYILVVLIAYIVVNYWVTIDCY